MLLIQTKTQLRICAKRRFGDFLLQNAFLIRLYNIKGQLIDNAEAHSDL